MNKYEEKARETKLQGYNCSYSVYNAYAEDFSLDGDYPEPRSIEGKCGALLSSLKILEETENAEKKEQFENEFIKEFGYSKCYDLMTHEARCNDYVGWSTNRLYDIICQNKK